MDAFLGLCLTGLTVVDVYGRPRLCGDHGLLRLLFVSNAGRGLRHGRVGKRVVVVGLRWGRPRITEKAGRDARGRKRSRPSRRRRRARFDRPLLSLGEVLSLARWPGPIPASPCRRRASRRRSARDVPGGRSGRASSDFARRRLDPDGAGPALTGAHGQAQRGLLCLCIFSNFLRGPCPCPKCPPARRGRRRRS